MAFIKNRYAPASVGVHTWNDPDAVVEVDDLLANEILSIKDSGFHEVLPDDPAHPDYVEPEPEHVGCPYIVVDADLVTHHCSGEDGHDGDHTTDLMPPELAVNDQLRDSITFLVNQPVLPPVLCGELASMGGETLACHLPAYHEGDHEFDEVAPADPKAITEPDPVPTARKRTRGRTPISE